MKKLSYLLVAVLVLGGIWIWSGQSDTSVPEPTNTVTISPTPTTTKTTTPTPVEKEGTVMIQVPFTAQAPLGTWSDSRQQDACEEASVIMAMHWVKGTNPGTLAQAEKAITDIADWQKTKYGSYVDTSTHDTVSRLFNDYFNYNNVRVEENISADDIIDQLEAGNIVIVMANGQALGNPFFTAPGPERHALVIIGYDYDTDQFVTNDPGTRSGKGYRYTRSVLIGAVRDYPTGDHEPILSVKKNMIVVEK